MESSNNPDSLDHPPPSTIAPVEDAQQSQPTAFVADQPVTLILRSAENEPSPPSSLVSPEQTAPVEEASPESHLESPRPPTPPSMPREHAYWADIEEDLSVPDEAEIKEIEAKADKDYSAHDHRYWENTFFHDLDDPEYCPVEKGRLTWKFKGVRGTRESPNYAKIMRSPPAYVGGYWWTVNFFPRGNMTTDSLSIYVECSPTMPSPNQGVSESEFTVLRGAPDATFNESSAPDVHVKFDQTNNASAWLDHYRSQHPPLAGQENNSMSSWRVPAQIGVILYNPEEPRTGWMQSSCHQFNPDNVDWGWSDFHGPWHQIHFRRRGQRQALLRHDTLAIDAYIRTFDDPTCFLWWHASHPEDTWDSFGLTGYRPLGESAINHSAEVAGLASWLHVAPFCKIIQRVDVLQHLTNCEIKPKPLCDALQKILWQLRCRGESSEYVGTDLVTSTLRNLHEYSNDVSEFWERLRRSLELELEGTDAGKEFAKLFDSPEASGTALNTLPRDFSSRISVPADQASTIRESLEWYFSSKPGRWALPPFLHMELNRQRLDRVTRQWQLLYNSVGLDEDLDLTPWAQEGHNGHYVLYGYVVHRGRRTSGKFFSILRPGGPGTRWLAFDDGSTKRVECLTRKTALGRHLGLGPQEKPNHKSGHDVAVVAMYIRSDVVNDFLPGPQGPWDVPEPMREYYEKGMYPLTRKADGNTSDQDLQVEVYSLPQFHEMASLFDTYDLMSRAKASKSVMYLTMPRSSTLVDLRKKIALLRFPGTENIPSERFRLWQIGHTQERYGSMLAFSRVSKLKDTLDLPVEVARFWMHVVSGEDTQYFAMPDPPKPVVSEQKPEESVVERALSDSDGDASTGLAATPPVESTSYGDAIQQPSPNDSSDDYAEPSAPTPPSTGVDSSNLAGEGADNNALVAAIVANDVEEMDSNQQTQNESSPEIAQQQPLASATAHTSEPAVLMVHGQRSTVEATQTHSVVHDVESAPTEPLIQLPVDHVYYFIQMFDVENQTLRTVGSFFSRHGEKIKPALRRHLAWPDKKDFLMWRRVDTTTVITLSAGQTFDIYVPDGTCFIVGDRLTKDKRAELHHAGLFANPERLVQYLWAESRRHPTQGFTGFKTIEATFTGDSYSGELKKGFYHGRGKHITDLGAIYEGDFVFGRRHGKGLMEYPSGDTYDGDWFDDQRHGQGTFVERKTGNKYVGGYKDGKRHGKGISYWEVADEEMDLCQICYGEEQDALFFDCGHVCSCVACAKQVDICPICRRNILSVVKIYRT